MAEPVSLNTIRNWKNADDGALGSLRKLRDVCLDARRLQTNAVHLLPVLIWLQSQVNEYR